MNKIDKVLISIQQGLEFSFGMYLMVNCNDSLLMLSCATTMFIFVFFVQNEQ